MEKNINIICTPLKFYTQQDEIFLFTWFKKIKCIEDIQGIGTELQLSINLNKLTRPQWRELRGIFKRYKFKNIKQLDPIKPELAV